MYRLKRLLQLCTSYLEIILLIILINPNILDKKYSSLFFNQIVKTRIPHGILISNTFRDYKYQCEVFFSKIWKECHSF